MKNIKLHAIVLALIILAEMIGTHTVSIGIGRIVLLPMLYALLMGILTTPKFLKLSSEKEMIDASSLIGVTLMLLMARYGTLSRALPCLRLWLHPQHWCCKSLVTWVLYS